MILLASSGGTPYYITPSDDIIASNNTCFFEGRPLQPCSTLETLAANYKSITSDDFGENLTLLFLPGNYVVQNMTYLNFTSFQVISLSPNETDSIVRIKYNDEMTITFSNISIMNIKSLELYSCGGRRTRGDVIKFISSKDMTVQILDSSIIGTENGSSIAIYHWGNTTSTINITNCTFASTSYSGAALLIQSINTVTLSVTIKHCTFLCRAVSIKMYDTNFFSNFNNHGWSTIRISNSSFSNSTAGAIIFHIISRVITITISNCNFTANTLSNYGGAISLSPTSTIISKPILNVLNTTFQNNSASCGGAIFTRNTVIHLYNNLVFSYNTAENGGAIFAKNTEIYLHGHSNFISNKANISGGAIMVRDSSIYLQGIISFKKNSAGSNGGALFVSMSTLNNQSGVTYFEGNRAQHGTRLYIRTRIDCTRPHMDFLQPSDWGPYFRGSINGSDLLYCDNQDNSKTYAILKPDMSHVVNICFCNDENKTDCSLRQKELSAYRGQLISFKVTSLTQCGDFTPSVLNICDEINLKLKKGKCYRNISKECEEVKLHVFNENVMTGSSLTLKLSKGPCRDINKLTVKVTFMNCPRGFQLDTSMGFEKCDCDKRLKALVRKLLCQIDNATLNYQGTFWFQHKNKILEVCRICPMDYCNETLTSLTIPDVNESQCANNRYGVVCGACKDSFSLALGSSRCIDCSKRYNFLWLVPLFAVMGLILVLSMLFLDLTVSIGLINGLIFYANILSISDLTNNYNYSIPLLSVFISWVNLDFGIETCFYSGMDMYQKTWLQFAFPLYIWLLVGLIIILSHYSTRVMTLLGRKVIPVLATLFLLSYAKMLKTIIAVFAFIEVLRGDADNTSDELVPRKVWYYDGNVKYLSGKHIPLFIVALLFLVVLFLPYTLLLTFGQCLRSLPRRKGSRWLHSTAFISIMDAYHAPFTRNHRYWTGLLLIIRCILLIIFVTTYDDENAIITSTFIISIVTIGFLLLKASLANRIYEKNLANILDNVSILNLLLLAAAIYYLDDSNGHNEYNVCHCLTASISVALMTFLAIIACHIYYKMKGFDPLKKFFEKITIARRVKVIQKTQPEDTPTFTTTTVELREALLESVKEKKLGL